MHICQIVCSWDHGGLEKHAIELCNALSQAHKVTVIVHPFMKDRFDPAVNIVVVDFKQPRWSPKLYWQLLNILNELKPDIIHAQANKAALLVARLRPWIKFKVGYVATLHNLKDNVSMFEGFDRVIVVSSRLKDLIKKAPVSVIYNGIVPPEPMPEGRLHLVERFNLDPSRPIWMAVGRLVEAKGFDHLIAALHIHPAQVVIIGNGPLEQALEQQIAELQVKVVMAGYCENSQRLLAVADGLVISSRNEGGPYTLVEALLSRVPVISTNVGMVAEFLPAEFVVPVGDVQALAERLHWADTHMDELRAATEPVFQNAQENLTLAAVIRKTEAAYQSALALHVE